MTNIFECNYNSLQVFLLSVFIIASFTALIFSLIENITETRKLRKRKNCKLASRNEGLNKN